MKNQLIPTLILKFDSIEIYDQVDEHLSQAFAIVLEGTDTTNNIFDVFSSIEEEKIVVSRVPGSDFSIFWEVITSSDFINQVETQFYHKILNGQSKGKIKKSSQAMAL